uniref:Reverse transcriptase domain-containing protein n=1 Tax=Caenorhabditis japonica TaxID=281687 RepID=A0A8R1E0M2_CAEJA
MTAYASKSKSVTTTSSERNTSTAPGLPHTPDQQVEAFHKLESYGKTEPNVLRCKTEFHSILARLQPNQLIDKMTSAISKIRHLLTQNGESFEDDKSLVEGWMTMSEEDREEWEGNRSDDSRSYHSSDGFFQDNGYCDQHLGDERVTPEPHPIHRQVSNSDKPPSPNINKEGFSHVEILRQDNASKHQAVEKINAARKAVSIQIAAKKQELYTILEREKHAGVALDNELSRANEQLIRAQEHYSQLERKIAQHPGRVPQETPILASYRHSEFATSSPIINSPPEDTAKIQDIDCKLKEIQILINDEINSRKHQIPNQHNTLNPRVNDSRIYETHKHPHCFVEGKYNSLHQHTMEQARFNDNSQVPPLSGRQLRRTEQYRSYEGHQHTYSECASIVPFDGKPEDYKGFMSNFLSMVDQNEAFTYQNKLSLLRKLVIHRAANCVGRDGEPRRAYEYSLQLLDRVYRTAAITDSSLEEKFLGLPLNNYNIHEMSIDLAAHEELAERMRVSGEPLTQGLIITKFINKFPKEFSDQMGDTAEELASRGERLRYEDVITAARKYVAKKLWRMKMNGSTVFDSDQHRSHTRSIHLTDVRSRNEYESDLQATSTPTTSKTILENNVNKSQSPNIHNSEKFSPDTLLGAVAFPSYYSNILPSHCDSTSIHTSFHSHTTREDLPTPTHRSTTEEEWDISLSEEIAQMWKMENIGINAPSSEEKKETTDLIKEFKNNLNELESGEIEVAFPWNDNKNKLAHNFNMAFVRLKSNFDRLQEKEMLEQYSAMFSEQLNSNIIEMVTPEMDRAEGPTYYIPHRAVMKLSSLTTKMRIVYDASSHQRDELSLNQCLHAGPSILQPLFGILIRARLTKYIIISDIAKTFHQVRLSKEERNVTRFMWVKDTKKPVTRDNIVVYRFQRVPFGITSASFLLAATIDFFPFYKESNR